MADTNTTNAEADKVYSAGWWLRQIERYEKTFEPWTRQGEKLLKLYAKQSQRSDASSEPRRFAMLYANTEVIKPAVYSRPPIPQASRRFKDRDPVGRLAAELLERSSAYEFERQNADRVFRSVRDDLVLPGRGTVWIRYEPEFAEDGVSISDERVTIDYINWRDFGHLPARVWDEVDAVWRRVFYSRSEAKRAFSEDIAKELSYIHKKDDKEKTPGGQDDDAEAKAVCYEIWCKKTKKQYIVAKEAEDFLRPAGPPPLDFENFFPCPKPVYSLVTTDNLIPTPDYKHYQDQAQEIDDLTARIGKLTDMLKMVGFYPSGAGDASAALEKAVDPGVENRIIAVESWVQFKESGGSRAIEWLPIKDIADTITACVTLRNQLVQDVYQISGISDILRGATDPNETASAQQLKAQWGSVRIKDRQQGMADFCRDVVRLVCEVIAERFEPQRVMKMANMELGEPPQPQPPQPGADPMAPPQPDPAMIEYQKKAQQYEQAFALLKDEKLRGFRIDIETDSTIQPNEDAEKQRANEFLTAFGGFIQQAMPIVAQAPEMMPMVKETFLFTVRQFRAGRMLEDAIEQSMDAVQQKITQQQQNPPPDPAMAKVEAEKERSKAELDMKREEHQQDMQFQREKQQIDLQLQQEKNAQAAQMNQQKMVMQGEQMQQQHALRQQGLVMDDGFRRDELATQQQQESQEDKAVVERLDQLTALVQQLLQQSANAQPPL